MVGAVIVSGLVATLSIAPNVAAMTIDPCAGTAVGSSELCNDTTTAEGAIEIIANILFFIIGAVAVIMIIYAGVRYTTSGGNPEAVKSAKNTLLYSVIGLVVAIFAYAIVRWIVGRVS